MAWHKQPLVKTDSGTYGREIELTKRWFVWSDSGVADNANDPSAAMNWLLNPSGGAAPATLLFPDSPILCILSQIDFDPIADFKWEFTIKYAPPEKWRGSGDNAFNFNTSGGTAKITQALSHVATYAPGDNVTVTTLQDGALNRDSSGVNGIDVDTGEFSFQITIYRTSIPTSYVDLLESLTDTVNAIDFTTPGVDGLSKTFHAGSCRFKGATGAKRVFSDWEITLNFVSSPNLTGITIGEGDNQISGIVKNGWDYLSVEYEDVDDATNHLLCAAPSLVYVDRVYPYENWTGILP